jgi:hypothetical protein
MTGCTAPRYGDHDYSQPPHNTPEDPRDVEDGPGCQAQSTEFEVGCQGDQRYELIMFQIATHDWIRLYACAPCTATLRIRHRKLGLGGTNAIARVRDAITTAP